MAQKNVTTTYTTHRYFKRRSAGVLLHLTSLPGPHGIGDLGRPAHRFLDWLESTGWRMWQMLPIGPIGKGNSPYSSESSYAIEPLLLSLDALADEGLLPRTALTSPRELKSGHVRYSLVRRFKDPRTRSAWREFTATGRERSCAYRNFLDREHAWLEPWCAWARETRGGKEEFHAFVQFMLDRQLRKLRTAARKRRILLFGDLPIFVPLESVEVETNPELFKLLPNGRPEFVSGVPPDRFNSNGQLWGHPQYRWGRHSRDGFRWWISRVEKQFERFDILRIDHFIGFHHLWQIPGRARSARRGRWSRTPGRALLEHLFKALDDPPLVAEDLGRVTPAVRRLRDEFALPGLYLLQHAFEREEARWFLSGLPERSIVYPGTHDDDTTEGWWTRLSREDRRRVREVGRGHGKRASEILTGLALASTANTAIIPMQDLLGLGSQARMNRPGVPRGNWRWRLNEGMLRSRDATHLRKLAARTNRLAGKGRTSRTSRRQKK